MKILVFDHYKVNPYFNMAFDEWMLQKVLTEESLICLRLYSWEIDTITFGFNQQQQKAFNNTKLGATPYIRRVTGGRGLFHDRSELTYSIALSANLISSGVVSESITGASAEFAKILVSFLKKLDITSDYVRKSTQCEKEKNFFHGSPCFTSFSKNEIVQNEKKIIASAQRRVFGAILQHGSIKINGVKNHDALPVNESKPIIGKEIEELTHVRFNECYPKFVVSFEDAFNQKSIRAELNQIDKMQLNIRKMYVQKYFAEKRNIIKQNEAHLSL